MSARIKAEIMHILADNKIDVTQNTEKINELILEMVERDLTDKSKIKSANDVVNYLLRKLHDKKINQKSLSGVVQRKTDVNMRVNRSRINILATEAFKSGNINMDEFLKIITFDEMLQKKQAGEDVENYQQIFNEALPIMMRVNEDIKRREKENS